MRRSLAAAVALCAALFVAMPGLAAAEGWCGYRPPSNPTRVWRCPTPNKFCRITDVNNHRARGACTTCTVCGEATVQTVACGAGSSPTGFGDTVCSPCPANCKVCSSTSVCTECYPGWTAGGGVCKVVRMPPPPPITNPNSSPPVGVRTPPPPPTVVPRPTPPPPGPAPPVTPTIRRPPPPPFRP